MSDNIQAVIVDASVAITHTITPEQAFQPAVYSKKETAQWAGQVVLRDMKKFSWLFMFALTFIACYHVIRLNFYSPHDYYAYQGVTGPYEYIRNPDGTASAGKPIISVEPGQRFAWIANFCLNPGVTVTSRLKLLQILRTGLPDLQIAERATLNGPTVKHCGPYVNSWVIPPESPPGIYEVKRFVIIREGGYFPMTQQLEPIRVIVNTPSDTLPPVETVQPQEKRAEIPVLRINPEIIFSKPLANGGANYLTPQ